MLQTILTFILKLLMDKYLPSLGEITHYITKGIEGDAFSKELLIKINTALESHSEKIDSINSDESLSKEEKESASEEAFDDLFDRLK